MKHLRRINENVNKTLIDEMISQLKESLTELTDDGSVLFQKDTDYKSFYVIEIVVKLDHYLIMESINDPQETINDLYSVFKKSHDEIIQIFELVNEGVIRSQIDYTHSSFCITSDDTWDWEGNGDDDDIYDVAIFSLHTKVKSI